jgi:hypothetical protein
MWHPELITKLRFIILMCELYPVENVEDPVDYSQLSWLN